MDASQLEPSSEFDAAALAQQVGAAAARTSPRRDLTTLAEWFATDDTVIAVLPPGSRHTSLALAHGLHHAQGKLFCLVVPKDSAHPALHRAPWLRDGVLEVWTYGEALRARRQSTRDRTRGKQFPKDNVVGPARALLQAGLELRKLLTWATTHDDLETGHSTTARGWSHRGQRVLSLKGRRKYDIVAGIDTTRNDKRLAIKAITDLTPEQVGDIKKAVEQGITDAEQNVYQTAAEHHFQERLRQQPKALELEHPVLREVPAWRPAAGSNSWGRGFIDLVGLNGMGEIVIVETKLGVDDELGLQGLDYFIWAMSESNKKWLADRLNIETAAPVRILYTVAGKRDSSPRLNRYTEAQLKALAPDIVWQVATIDGWNSKTPKVRVLPAGDLP